MTLLLGMGSFEDSPWSPLLPGLGALHNIRIDKRFFENTDQGKNKCILHLLLFEGYGKIEAWLEKMADQVSTTAPDLLLFRRTFEVYTGNLKYISDLMEYEKPEWKTWKFHE